MGYERQAALLLDVLRQRWGDEPGWTLRPNKDYGFYLLYRRDLVSLTEVRQLIVDTFGSATGPTFIIGDLSDDA
jgi:hypothetical protein